MPLVGAGGAQREAGGRQLLFHVRQRCRPEVAHVQQVLLGVLREVSDGSELVAFDAVPGHPAEAECGDGAVFGQFVVHAISNGWNVADKLLYHFMF